MLTSDFVHSAIQKLRKNSHAGLHVVQFNFNHKHYIPFLQKRQSSVIHDCFDCHKQKYRNFLNQNKEETLPISKLSTLLNHSVSLDKKVQQTLPLL